MKIDNAGIAIGIALMIAGFFIGVVAAFIFAGPETGLTLLAFGLIGGGFMTAGIASEG